MKKFLCPPPAIITFFFLLTSEAKAQLNIAVTTSDYHGYHISCFGMQNGSISLSVTLSSKMKSYNGRILFE